MQQIRSLTEGSVNGTLFQFALPILCANILQSVNGTVNAVWVGHYLGEAALAAVSNANFLMSLLTGAAFGIEVSASILIGQCMGAANRSGAKCVVGTGSTFFAVMSIVVALVGIAVAPPLLVAMNTPEESLALAVGYMRVLLLVLPITNMNALFLSLLRGTGDSKTPLRFVLLSVALGVVLNPLFIFGVDPIPGFGLTGSALAMFFANSASLTMLVIHLYRHGHALCLHRGELGMLRMDWAIVRTLTRQGIPTGMLLLVMSLSGVLMIGLVNRFGVDTTAAYGASMQLWSYIQMPALAIGAAVSTMVAQNVGARNWERVRSIARAGVFQSILLTCSVVLVLYALDTIIYRLFLPIGSPALQIASHINRVSAWSFVLFGICVALFSVMRATGSVMVPLVVHSISLLVVRFPLAAMLMGQWHAEAIWWSFPISSVIAVALAALYYRYGGWRRMQPLISAPAAAMGAPSSEDLH